MDTQGMERGHSCPPCADGRPCGQECPRSKTFELYDISINSLDFGNIKIMLPLIPSVKNSAYHIVARKRDAEGPLEMAEAEVRRQYGFQGWRTRGYLPHCDIPGTLQMITFRLSDAMPVSRRREWEALTRIEDERQRRIKLEAYLDLGYGSCVLKRPSVAKVVERVIQRFDGRRYRLVAWVVMPNHVHVLVELWTMPMGELLKAWKGTSANTINRLLGRSGELWQDEYWDRYMRDEAHFRKAVRYIESNPLKAGQARVAAEWPFSSANPKWRWTGPDRYYGAQLVWDRQPEKGPERGHSCPLGVERVPATSPQHYSSAGFPLPPAKEPS